MLWGAEGARKCMSPVGHTRGEGARGAAFAGLSPALCARDLDARPRAATPTSQGRGGRGLEAGGHAGAALLSARDASRSIVVCKTLTMEAVSHSFKNNQPPPTHARKEKVASHVLLTSLLRDKINTFPG